MNKIRKTTDWVLGLGCLAVTLSATTALGAPFPATSTSAVTSSAWGFFLSPQGFQMDARSSAWRIEEPPADSENISILFRQPGALDDVEFLMTVRSDDSVKSSDRAAYMRRWTTLYQRLGFQILGTRDLRIGENDGTMIDLVNPEQKRQLRQFVFIRKPHSVIMTCSDHISRFEKRVGDCDRLAGSLRWTGPVPGNRVSN